MSGTTVSPKNTAKIFRFPWEIREIIILSISSAQDITPDTADNILSNIERTISKDTEWKTGEDLFIDMDKGLAEHVVLQFLFLILGKILKDTGADTRDIRTAIHDKDLMGGLEGALTLLKRVE